MNEFHKIYRHPFEVQVLPRCGHTAKSVCIRIFSVSVIRDVSMQICILIIHWITYDFHAAAIRIIHIHAQAALKNWGFNLTIVTKYQTS